MLYELLDQEKKHGIDILKNKVQPYLARIVVTFPEYTDHSIEHSNRILKVIENVILDKNNIEYLRNNQWNLFFLLASIYLHDLGMVDFSFLKLEIPEKEKQNNIRKNHHIRSCVAIEHLSDEFGLNDFSSEIICKIVKNHRGQLDRSILTEIETYEMESINIGFLISILRLGDELDLSSSKVNRQIKDYFIKNEISKYEWNKHFSIGSVTSHPEIKHTILIKCKCKDKNIHRSLKKIETKINNLFFLINSHVEPRLKYIKCNFEIENRGYIDKDIKFTIDENSLWPLIIGQMLYDDKRVFVRELVQNALDATSLKANRSTNEYTPKIEIKYHTNVLEVIDNGIGMSIEEIEKYLTRICLSYYGENLNKLNKNDFYPISKFGIGIFSCFMVSEKVTIKTSNGSGKCYFLTITDIKNYVHLEENNENYIGTSVKVYLKENIKNFIIFIRDTFRYLEIPIQFYYPDNSIEVIGRRPANKQEMIEFQNYNFNNIIEYPITSLNSIGYIWEGGNYSNIFKDKKVLLLMDGIKIGKFDFFPNWLNMDNFSGFLNLKKSERVTITASRNEIQKDDKYHKIVNAFEKALYPMIEKKLNNIDNNIDIRQFFQSNIKLTTNKYIFKLIKKYYIFEYFMDEIRSNKNQKPIYLKYDKLLVHILKQDNDIKYHCGRNMKTYDGNYFKKIYYEG